MPLFGSDDEQNAAEALREFEDALLGATDTLNNLAVGGGGGGVGAGDGAAAGGGGAGTSLFAGKAGIGKRLLGAVGKTALGVGAAAASAGIAAADSFLGGSVATGGRGDIGAGTLNRGLISAVSKIPIIGAGSGADFTNRVLGRAENRTGSLANLARFGVDVTDEMIQRELDITIPQEKRAAEVEARIKGISGSLANVAQAEPDNLENGMSKIISLLEGLTGGSAR